MSKMNLSGVQLKTGEIGGQADRRLSMRQSDCLRLVAEGFTSKEIARELGISPSTVDNHIKAAVDRLGARNRTDAARLVATREEKVFFAETTDLDDHVRTAPNNAADSRFSLFRLPPLGGRRNELPTLTRLAHIAQIAVFSLIIVSAAILTIAGVVHVLSR